jgi:hypothetical protein
LSEVESVQSGGCHAGPRTYYREFMNEGDVVKKQEVYAVADQRLQGDDDFVDRVLEQYDGEVRKEKKRKEHTMPEISRAVTDYNGPLERLSPKTPIESPLPAENITECCSIRF